MKNNKSEPIPVMDYRQYRRVRRLVHECCNYIDGNCIALDDGEESPWQFVSGKTAKSILISCGARLAPFDIAELREIMSFDELELDKLGDEKTALFFLISDTDTTYNFIVALAFSQMFNLLCERADNKYGGSLP